MVNLRISKATLSSLGLGILLAGCTNSANNPFTSSDGSNLLEPLQAIVYPIFSLFFQVGQITDVDQLAAITRFMLWIAIFTIVHIGTGRLNWVQNNAKIALAFVFATISAVFMPQELIISVGGSWGQIAFLVLLSPILIALIAAIRSNWSKDDMFSKLLVFFSSLLLFYTIAYFNSVFKNSSYAYKETAVTGFTNVFGIVGLVFQIAAAIAAILVLITLVRLFGGGTGGGGGGGLGNIFGGGGGGGNNPPTMPTPDPRIEQDMGRIANLSEQMRDSQSEIDEIERQMRNPAAALTPEILTRLQSALANMRRLRTEYSNLVGELTRGGR